MKVRIATAGDQPWNRQVRAAVEEVARIDRFGEHVLAADAHEADLILFVDLHQHPGDWRMRTLRDHPLVRAFPEKSFVYDERDLPRDVLPGIYVGMPASRFDQRRQRAFSYYRLLTDTRAAASDPPDLLFSFQGRRVGPLRDRVLALSHPRAVVEDTSAYDFFGADARTLAAARARYRDVLGRSKFVLCPRGAGTSSIRLFEALACGRVPVVLSDEWVPPRDVDWASGSVRVAESETSSLPERLEALEAAWPAMSTAALRIYEQWFAPEVWFHRVVEHCRELLLDGALGVAPQWTRAELWRAGARHLKASALRRSSSSRPGRGTDSGATEA